MAAQHEHRYDIKVVDEVRTLDGFAEDVLVWRCTCGAIKPPASGESAPKPGEWV